MSIIYMNLTVNQPDELRSTFPLLGPGWNWSADSGEDLGALLRDAAEPGSPPHHHSSGLCFVVSYALITSDWETIPFSS